jgi:hypothetical protein
LTIKDKKGVQKSNCKRLSQNQVARRRPKNINPSLCFLAAMLKFCYVCSTSGGAVLSAVTSQDV